MRSPDLVEVEKIILNNIPCLLVRPKSFKEKLPTLFHYHGWSSKKENHKFFATTICQYGYQVILPDSNYHGDRNPLNEYDVNNLKEYFPKIIIQSVDEFNQIRREAEKLYQVDEKRIAVSGNSMGGFIASSIFGKNQDIKALICLNGGSSWKKAMDILKEMGELDEEYNVYTEEMKKFDPLTYKNKFYPRPILMLHGDSDTLVPIAIQRYSYEEVYPLYKKEPERIKLEEYKNINHHISIRMVESTVMWLDKYL